MTNEWLEFHAYTAQPVYTLRNKKSTAYLGRFTSDMIRSFSGFSRIFTILARGILFHLADGGRRTEDPYSRIDTARRFLCAWCSIPDAGKDGGGKRKAHPKADTDGETWRYRADFRDFHEEFPDTVTPDGRGWFYRHVHTLSALIGDNRGRVNTRLHCLADRMDGWDNTWRKRVIHYQVPLFSESTRAEWSLSFDSAIADALDLGPLRTQPVVLSESYLAYLRAIKPDKVPDTIMSTLAAYYVANKQPDSDWVVLPVTNMEAYFGSTALSRQYLAQMPKAFMERKTTSFGVCVYKLVGGV